MLCGSPFLPMVCLDVDLQAGSFTHTHSVPLACTSMAKMASTSSTQHKPTAATPQSVSLHICSSGTRQACYQQDERWQGSSDCQQGCCSGQDWHSTAQAAKRCYSEGEHVAVFPWLLLKGLVLHLCVLFCKQAASKRGSCSTTLHDFVLHKVAELSVMVCHASYYGPQRVCLRHNS